MAVRYPLRTPVIYWLGLAPLVGLCGWLAVLATQVSGGRAVALLAFAAAVPLLMLAFTTPYRAWPGGHLTFTDDALVVRRGRQPVALRRADGVQVTIAQVRVQVTAALIPVATLDRGQMITLASSARSARFSTLLVAPAVRGALLADLARAVRGEPAQGPTPPAPPAPPGPRTDADARLDAELELAER